MTTQAVLDAYNAAWGETDAAVRRELLEASWADDGVYTDPMTVAVGREGLIEWIGAMHQQFPGCGIQQTGEVEEHHGAVHFTWDFTVDGVPVISGRDFVLLAPDGRIQSITGFYPPPTG
ncbi:MAG: nuclear transport factor 2 family protein [Actinomycetes bacterium]